MRERGGGESCQHSGRNSGNRIGGIKSIPDSEIAVDPDRPIVVAATCLERDGCSTHIHVANDFGDEAEMIVAPAVPKPGCGL